MFFTHDSLLQTLQVLFGLLVALMQESDRKGKPIIADVFQNNEISMYYLECPLLEFKRRDTKLYKLYPQMLHILL